MRFLQLKYFTRVAELKSISKAAVELSVSPSVISTQIKSLEEELETPLFERQGNLFLLTDGGALVYPYLNQVLRTYSTVKRKISDRNGRLDYDLNIATLTLPTMFPDIIEGFKQAYPSVQLKIQQYQHFDNFEESDCDILIHFTDIPAAESNTICLYHDPIRLAVSADHPMAGQRLNPLALREERFILSSKYSDFYHIQNECIRILNIVPQYTITNDYPPFVRRMVINQFGVSFLSVLSWYFSPDRDQIRLLRLRDTEPVRYINLSWKSSGYVSSAARRFTEYISHFFSNLNLNAV